MFHGTSNSRRRADFLLLLASSLTVLLAQGPDDNRLRIAGGDRIEMNAAPGRAYQLQIARSLGGTPAWENSGPALTVGAAGPVSWPLAATESERYFRVEIRLAGAGLSRAEAEARVIAEIIRPASQSQLVLGLRWPLTLDAGTIIQPLSNPEENPKSWTVNAPSYLFVIDHAPSQKLGHPFSYALVDIASGAIRVIPAFYPPVVNGAAPLATLEERWRPEARFFPADFATAPALAPFAALDFPPPVLADPAPFARDARNGARALGAATTSTAHSTVDCARTPGKKIAVVIASGADYEIQNDARDMSALLERAGFQVTAFNSKSNSVTEVIAGLQRAGQGLGPCDKFFVYLSSHTQLVDENDDGKPDNTPSRLDFGLGHANKSLWSWLPGHPGSLATILQGIHAGKINLMMDTCFAESFAVLMRTRRAQRAPGSEWSIFESSSASKTSGGATELDLWLDYGNDEVHSQYSGRILAKVKAALDANQVDTNDDGELSIQEIEQAFLNAHFAVENELANGQMPHFDRFEGAVPAASSDTFAAPPGHPITHAAATGDTLVPGTQFVLVDPPALHADLYSWGPRTGQMTLTGLSTLTAVTFRYKLVAGFYETDPVTVTIQFDPRRNYAVEFLQSAPDKVRVPCLKIGNLLYPIYQFRLANNPADVCKEPHWHSSGEVFAIDVISSTGIFDPNPGECGYGTVKQIPTGFFELSKDAWETFLIDHIPPF